MTAIKPRKKNPAALRETLLACAETLALTQGIQSVTMQAVSDAAGVTKGGFLHHFPTKDALLQALFAAYVARFEATLTRLMRADPQPSGRFSRAYIRATLDPTADAETTAASGLVAAFIGTPALRVMWYDWMQNQERLHAATDGAPAQQIARHAADGAWFARIDQPPLTAPDPLLQPLLQLATSIKNS